MQQDEIEKIIQSAHFVSAGFFFKSEDKTRTELDTQKLLQLKHIAEQAVKTYAQNLILIEQNKDLQHENLTLKADYDFLTHEFQKLDNETKNYTAVPIFWRKHIDNAINEQQKLFTAYCHTLNRAILRILLATHGDLQQTEHILHNLLKEIGIKNTEKHIANVIDTAIRQHNKKCQPEVPPPSWKHPKPNDTDYSKPDEPDVVPLQLSNVPDIYWNLLNWELLSELDKDEFRKKKIIRKL